MEDENMQNIEITPAEVKQAEPAAEEVKEETVEETVETPAEEAVEETAPEETSEPESGYDWETDINTRVGELENSLKSYKDTIDSLVNQITVLEQTVATLTKEQQERQKKLSGFFKPVDGKLPDETKEPRSIDDLYTMTKK